MSIFSQAKNNIFFNQSDWEHTLYTEYSKPYFKKLEDELARRVQENPALKICPSPEKIFKAFIACPFQTVRVVMVGQDPYPNHRLAEGTAFSVPSITSEKDVPATLKNLFRELRRDLNLSKTTKMNPHLGSWSDQGVLLLNRCLTTEYAKPAAHRGIGWERFTDAVIAELNDHPQPLVFVLMGTAAQDVRKLITDERHQVIETAHPSPQSAHRGFYFSNLFSRINDSLVYLRHRPIWWESVCYKKYS